MNSVEEIIADIRAGKMVVIMDDEGRENEGDLIMAASAVRAEHVNFMATHGRGLICLTLSRRRCQQLRLPLMVTHTKDLHSTKFTVSIEAAAGVTTGISAADRARTIQAAVAADAKPEDLVQPGHIFPLMAEDGGVLTRAGHTEAGCDLARLSGSEAAAVIVEILNPDGTMARRPDLEKFASVHSLKIGTIDALIRYRIENEKTVERVAETEFPTQYGNFHLYAYQDNIQKGLHLALVKGDIKHHEACSVRVHVENLLRDTLSAEHGGGWPLQSAMRRIAEFDEGVLVLLRPPQDQGELVRTIQDFQLSGGKPEGDELEVPPDYRTNGIGSQILADLGVGKMRLLGRPRIYHGLGGFGLEIVEYISL